MCERGAPRIRRREGRAGREWRRSRPDRVRRGRSVAAVRHACHVSVWSFRGGSLLMRFMSTKGESPTLAYWVAGARDVVSGEGP